MAEIPGFLELLAERRSGTADIGLYWSPRINSATVVVSDDARGEHLELPVRPGDNPLDLFRHPYAYAAGRRCAVATLAEPSRHGALCARTEI
jgi:hypothetical protein